MSAFDPYDLVIDDIDDPEDIETSVDDSFRVRAKNWEWEWFASGALVLSMIVAACVGNAGIVLLCLLAIMIKLLTSDKMLNTEPLEEYSLEAEFRKLEIEALLKDLKERL